MARYNMLLHSLYFFPIIVISLSHEDAYQAVNIDNANTYRLPNETVPIHYNVRLNPQISESNNTFEGEIGVDFKVRKSTTNVVLHSRNLLIDESVTRVTSNGNDLKWQRHIYDEKRDMLQLSFENSLQPGLYTINMKFTGNLNDNLCGFFRSFYQGRNNSVPFLATHFQKTSARQAFPCWDEPALKATFNISLKHFDNYTALSNMPVSSTEYDEMDGKYWTNFETTPLMSTNILAFVVSDFAHISGLNGTTKIWANEQVIPSVGYFMTVQEKVTMALTKYLNSTIRVPKMDHVIVPWYSAKAAENWGLIIYLEAAVLNKFSNVMTVTHELSHQWFGNLVSPAWWKYYWMSEGMATYLKYFITDQILKDWKLIDALIGEQINSFHADDVSSAIAINEDVIDAKSYKNLMFVYIKPSVIFWMLSNILGEDTFRDGLIRYISAHEYSSVTSDDLWEAMQNALDRSDTPHLDFRVKDVMDTWIEQTGYPLVTVTRNYSTGDTIIRQEPSIFSEDQTRKQWWIPINYATKSAYNFSVTKPMYFLKPDDKDIVIHGIHVDDWIIVNLQHTGYYRVNYDTANWQKVANFLNTGDYQKIHVGNRIQLMDTAFHLMKSNKFAIHLFMDLTNYLRRETDGIVWKYAFTMLRQSEKYIRSPKAEGKLKSHVLDLMKGLLETLNYDEMLLNGDDFFRDVKIEAATIACRFGNPECKAKAKARLHAYLEDPETNSLRNLQIGIVNSNKLVIY
ncbi:PREDICTED: aminopeptidase N-like [Eufriesea mexicana]|uniref:aminopeptidase N-like n=1 Tax=Eufriesea mexicana TaxID=516756 RepID=UPI00083BDDE5|nr:PREDICTED: aminopeptidase N-like [Eufriesea mexicana]